MILFFVLYLIILFSVNAWHDADYKNLKDAHLSGGIFVILIVIGFFMLSLIGFKFSLDEWDQMAYFTFVALTIRWNVFDIVYNRLTKQPWYYVGSTSTMDKLSKKAGIYAFYLKWICLFLAACMCLSFGGIGIN